MKERLTKIHPSTYILPQEGIMRVPGLVIASESQLANEDIERPLEQVKNVASLLGIVGYSIAMPDIHWGYGFPIGGVAAMDAQEGVISPGGVGYDINCGVRLAIAPIPFASLAKSVKQSLLQSIFQRIPSGMGQGKATRLSNADYENLACKGALWSIEQGFGDQVDLEHIESMGVLEEADIGMVSEEAKKRGSFQLGSIGSGNHFVEIGEVETLFLPDIAKRWKVVQGDRKSVV